MADPKFGRRPPKRSPSIMFADIRTAVVPEHPASEDYLSSFKNWQMLGNDTYGDCVAVTWANMRRMLTGALTGTEYYPTIDQVYQVYRLQNPNFVPNPSNPVEDNGMDIQTLLEYLNKYGGPDGVPVVAFASVDYKNLDEVKAALAIFGGLWLGINVQAENQSEFKQGQPWDYVQGSPIVGGHSILSGGYFGQTTDDVRFITWAQETGFTDNFWANSVEELWAVIWPEHLGTKEFMAGVDLNKLATDYQAITGRPLPLTPPTPLPAPPQPPPAPAPAGNGCLNLLGQFFGGK
jgi:hypothetical protein